MLQPRLMAVRPLPDYKLELVYETGEQGTFDVAPYISGSWFGQLKDPLYFKTVHLVSDGAGLEWANGQDIAPHELFESCVPA